MKWFLNISFLILSVAVYSQNDPAVLSAKLTNHLTTDAQKVKAIFKWITENIAYSTKKGIAKYNKSNEMDPEDDGPLKSLTERVAITVLKRKMAVCDGYARLFTSLCSYAGIRSEIVLGYAKTTSNKPLSKFGVNHYWNVVFFDNKWHLLDATWASGYLSGNGNEFIRDYDDKYFLTAPEVFIEDHYPDDIRWTLLPEANFPEEFRFSPFKQISFSKYDITSFSPTAGIINAFVGDTISLKLEASMSENRKIASSQIVNPGFYNFSSTWVFLKPEKNETINGMANQCQYKYTVTSENIQWLYLVYNNDLVLRYKINVKNKRS